MGEATVRAAGRQAPLNVRINGPRPNFTLASETIEKKALHELDPILLDLMEIAATVFAADSAVPRGGATRPQMGAGWYRQFEFEIPVRELGVWQRSEVMDALREAVEILTEDSVEFRFTQATPDTSPEPYLDLNPDGPAFAVDEVILFSGGLDSFAGALEVLATTQSRVVLVTHRSAQKVIPRQVELGKYLSEQFPGRVLHINVLARRVHQQAQDSTQRSRTLLFSALGQTVAQTFGAKRISFFENGIVSHNLPLSPQIVGTMATRTTHPLALRLIGQLMQVVVPAAIPIENRFQWLTKSEVVTRIAEYGAETKIARAVSCTSVREQNTLHTHCGACTQCFDRRFAILHAGLGRYDPDEIYATDVLFGERHHPRSKTMAVEWTRHALRLSELDEQRFIERFGHEVSRVFRGHADLPRGTALDLTLRMHHRHSTTVRTVLEGVLKERASDFIDQKFPASSLVCLHLSPQDGPVGLVPEYHLALGQHADIADIEETDVMLPADGGLQVIFSIEGDRHIVDVIGLATLTGPPARIPHALKPTFEEDRQSGIAWRDYRYVNRMSLPRVAEMNKTAIRKAVQRCRKRLADEYELLHGEPPPEHLLIQNRPTLGYRLDPRIEILPATQRYRSARGA